MLAFKKYLRFNQAGDTIVEVLIATAVVSLVLTGAFAAANRSAVQIRMAQEQGEALKFTSAVLENIKSSANSVSAFDAPFCRDTTTGYSYAKPNGSGSGDLLPALSSDSDAFYVNAGCKNTIGGVTYFTSVEPIVSAGRTTFIAHTRWDRAGGGTRQEVTLSYRLEQ